MVLRLTHSFVSWPKHRHGNSGSVTGLTLDWSFGNIIETLSLLFQSRLIGDDKDSVLRFCHSVKGSVSVSLQYP